MRKILFVLLFVVALPMLASAYEDCGIRFSDLHGQVAVRPDEEFDDAYEYASLDTVLRFNDRIWTEIDSGAILSLTDMSTFVVKQNTIMVLPKPETQVSSIKILSGNVWINMKKMVEGGEFNIEMNQAVAGIKGTNIVCRSGIDEDRIQCLHGRVQIRNRMSGEIIYISDGEEAVIGGDKSKKGKIDVNKIEEEWKKDTDKMGSALPDNELINLMTARANAILLRSNELTQINNSIGRQRTQSASDLEMLEKLVSSFRSELFEARSIVEQAISRINGSSEKMKIFGLTVSKVLSVIKSSDALIQTLINSIKRYSESMKRNNEYFAEEILEQLSEKVSAAQSQFVTIRQELSDANGKSQDWFQEKTQECDSLLEVFVKLLEDKNRIPPEYAANPLYTSISRTLETLNGELARTSRFLRVVNIEFNTIDTLKNFEETISDYIVIYNQELDKYNSIDKESTTSQFKILTQSLRVLGGYARTKRQYAKAQRLYEKVIRFAGSNRYKTAEMLEVEDLWNRIKDNFMTLSDLKGVLQSRIADLESQINRSGRLGR